MGIEDFEPGAEQQAFARIERAVHALCPAPSRLVRDAGHPGHAMRASAAIWEATAWVFGGRADETGVGFELCCATLSARPDVLRLRVVYEWWLRWVVFPVPFPFECMPLPVLLAGDIDYLAGEVGIRLAHRIWCQPGLQLVDSELDVRGARALERLQARLLVSVHDDGGLYLTGRNPMLARLRAVNDARGGLLALRGGSVNWSSLF